MTLRLMAKQAGGRQREQQGHAASARCHGCPSCVLRSPLPRSAGAPPCSWLHPVAVAVSTHLLHVDVASVAAVVAVAAAVMVDIVVVGVAVVVCAAIVA